jgi:hypothetical protein
VRGCLWTRASGGEERTVVNAPPSVMEADTKQSPHTAHTSLCIAAKYKRTARSLSVLK